VAEQRAKGDISFMLSRELLNNFGAALGVGAIIFGNDFNFAAIDAAFVIDQLCCRFGRAIVPAAIGRADSGFVDLETNFDRLRCLRLNIWNHTGQHLRASGDSTNSSGPFEQRAAALRFRFFVDFGFIDFSHCAFLRYFWLAAKIERLSVNVQRN